MRGFPRGTDTESCSGTGAQEACVFYAVVVYCYGWGDCVFGREPPIFRSELPRRDEDARRAGRAVAEEIMKQYLDAAVVETQALAKGIYSTVLRAEGIVGESLPGQFVCVYCGDGAHLLPRPISICDIDPGEGTLRLVYRVVGFGTKELSERKPGDTVRLLGPIGTGYESVSEGSERPVRILLGGGIGIPPMLLLAKEWHRAGYEVHAVLGYRDAGTFLLEDMEPYASVHIATDDGSLGTRGTVLDAVTRENLIPVGAENRTLLAACGPMPMLRGVAAFAQERGIPAYVSLEERMACGVGACLGCVVKSREKDGHSHVHNKRVCTEGPVFEVRQLCL